MPPAMNDVGNDDYIAQVLAQEARDSSLKYSAQGMGAYMPKRPTGAAPKPNTRFLRHIIKETDNHNTALKRKEEREARERMRQLRDKNAAGPREAQRRQNRHADDREDRHRSHHRRRHRSRSADGDRDRSRKHRRRHESHESDEERYRSSRRSRRHRSYSRSRSRSRSPRDKDEEVDSRSRRRRHRRRSASPSRSRSRSRDAHDRRKDRHGRKESRRHTSRERASSSHKPATTRETPTENQRTGYESDPLEDLVGPLPPTENPAPAIRYRGRGTYNPNLSNIDAHFAPDYDPTLDVQPDDDEFAASSKSARRPVAGLMTGDDDWEMSLEALRDRAHWKRRGEDRLREAGFNDAFVEKWKSNTTAPAATGEDSEGRLEDVRWSKKGEGREWDRGKFVDDDGHIDVKASW